MTGDESARRVASMDQVRAGISDLARLVIHFYDELRAEGIPKDLCGELAREMLRGMMTQNGGQLPPGR